MAKVSSNASDEGLSEGWDHDAKLGTDVKPAELWGLTPSTATGWAKFGNPPPGLTQKRQSSWDEVVSEDDDEVGSSDEEGHTSPRCRLQPEETSPMQFEVMYYGNCPEIGLAPRDSAGMPQIDARKLLQAKRAEEQRDGKRTCYRCQIFFSKKGVYVSTTARPRRWTSWTTNEVVLMTTVKASKNTGWWDEYWNGTERVALLKVLTSALKVEWHVFKYAKSENDNMQDKFNELLANTKTMTPLTPSANIPTKNAPAESVRKLELEVGDN